MTRMKVMSRAGEGTAQKVPIAEVSVAKASVATVPTAKVLTKKRQAVMMIDDLD